MVKLNYLTKKCCVTVAAGDPLRILSLFFITILLIVIKACLLFVSKDVIVLGTLEGGGGFCCGGGRFTTISKVVCEVGRGTNKLTDVYILSAVILIIISAAIDVCTNVRKRLGRECPSSVDMCD